MIKINLLGHAKVKGAKPRAVRAPSSQALSLIMAVSVVLISLAIVYFWQNALAQEDTELTRQINLAKKEKLRQESLLKENEVFEKRRKLLENRIEVIESLKKNQSGPVLVLDTLSDCVQQTDGLWLKDFTQKDNTVTLNGMVMGSPKVIADFITNLERVGRFRNVNLVNVQEVENRYSFSITFEGDLVPQPESGGAPPASKS
ncbi:MAG: PilN domain-containing protein [Acidobacteriota bacterium]